MNFLIKTNYGDIEKYNFAYLYYAMFYVFRKINLCENS